MLISMVCICLGSINPRQYKMELFGSGGGDVATL